MIPLEPCPFCGHKAIVIDAFSSATYAQCQNPDCAASIGVNGGDRIQAVMARWNRRAVMP